MDVDAKYATDLAAYHTPMLRHVKNTRYALTAWIEIRALTRAAESWQREVAAPPADLVGRVIRRKSAMMRRVNKLLENDLAGNLSLKELSLMSER